MARPNLSNFEKRKEWATAEEILKAMQADDAADAERCRWEAESDMEAEHSAAAYYEDRYSHRDDAYWY